MHGDTGIRRTGIRWHPSSSHSTAEFPTTTTSHNHSAGHNHGAGEQASAMARLRSAPFRRGSTASSPDNSDEEPDPHPLDDEVLKDDFLEGLSDEAQDSPFHGDDDDGANPRSLQEESEDEPNSQIQREAQSARSPGNNRKLTDEEQAAFIDSAALLSNGRGPAPLPSKAERRAASRDGHSTTSTPRSAKRSAHPEVHVVPVNYKPNYASASASDQPETQAEDEKGSEGRQLRRSTKAQRSQKDKEDAAVAAPVVPQKRKPGRPKKTATNAEIIKRQKINSAKTGQRKSKTGEAVRSEEGNRSVEGKSTTTTTPSGSKKLKSTPKKAMTSSERLSQMKSKRKNEQEASEYEEEAPRRALLDDWRRLHILRKDIEPDCGRWRHLDAVPPPSAREPELIRDIDVNGQPFDRVVMFHHPRTNPRRYSLEMTQELVGVDWTDLECLTLMEALAKYTAMEFSESTLRYT